MELSKFGKKLHSSNFYSETGALSNALVQKRKISFFGRYIKNKKIVELGCGRGVALKELQKYSSFPIKGCDINKIFCKNLKKEGIKAFYADLDKKIPLKDNSIEVVYSDQVMEHLISPVNFLGEIHRILTSEGIVIIGVPNIRSVFTSSWYNPVHINFYNKKTLKYSLRSMGFNILETFYHPPKSFKKLKGASQIFPFFSNTLYIIAKKDNFAKEKKIRMLGYQGKEELLRDVFK